MKVVIDASNVASYKRDENSKPKLNYILSAVKALEQKNNEFIIVADASLKHEIDDKDKYNQLLEEKTIEQVKPGHNADQYILNIANEKNAKILSNDLFREFRDEFHDINNMRIPFSFKDDRIILGKTKKPKKVKNILQKISDNILSELDNNRREVYTDKNEIDFSPLNITKEALLRMDKSQRSGVGNKIEGVFSKIPMFGKVIDMIDDVESSAPYVIFVLVNPKNYKEAVKNAGNISVTIGDRLNLDKNPLIAVRNDLFMKPDKFDLNIIYSDEVEEESYYNVNIRINTNDELFIKKNSRNIASTVAGRIGSWKFPIVSVKVDMLLEKPGDYEIFLEKGGNLNV
ncbi:NYN domain-containing protein [Methanobrevibacter filiformis]|uniref:Zc3h12a-like ribonuclease NYN domain protein n=1 Tax=Methanobrevibacter filiformis TaxID=55758 RepID=A0A166DA17_9EURY|nr:Zc3h12a-like ribonuclease [Methanobrevibacter filiformis]KZX15362.1 Zc3h12a-like ribonuclease NYN domain protein [Methanobrevibacter filiformis]